ncbi:hypothetical protein Pmani_017381 [Petrolisthes manimaculis]|uniref:Uncharacterized protein n=1 Tax=Petrolisthes manimaculis TaxID=1843537 RepID=A0AAE1U9Y1_9EUCA|nr:hypothetical protein Pmani_017381 [Petrolisthes manimaculis]
MSSTGDGVFTLLCSVVGTSDGRVPPSKYPPSLMLSVVPSHWTVSLVCSEVVLKTEVLVAGAWESEDRPMAVRFITPVPTRVPTTTEPGIFHASPIRQAVTELVLGDTLAAVASKLSVRVGTHCKTHMETGIRELLPDPLSVVDADASCFKVGGFKEVLDKEYKTGWWIKDSELNTEPKSDARITQHNSAQLVKVHSQLVQLASSEPSQQSILPSHFVVTGSY